MCRFLFVIALSMKQQFNLDRASSGLSVTPYTYALSVPTAPNAEHKFTHIFTDAFNFADGDDCNIFTVHDAVREARERRGGPTENNKRLTASQ